MEALLLREPYLLILKLPLRIQSFADGFAKLRFRILGGFGNGVPSPYTSATFTAMLGRLSFCFSTAL